MNFSHGSPSLLAPFMEPKSLALIGVSREVGEEAFNMLGHLLSYGYSGKIYPVNPNATEILGLKAYPHVTEIPEEVALAVISTPRELVPQLIRECTSKGIHSIIVVGQGFADANDERGKQLQREIVDLAQAGQTRIIGPNTFGTANAFANFSTAFARLKMEKVPIGVVCQSGVFFMGFSELNLIGKGFDLGNACDVDSAEALEYFANDSEVKVVALHIEGVSDGRRFLQAASQTSRRKPLLVLKTGKSEPAAEAARSHTGAITGQDQVWEAALKQTGAIRVEDVEELLDLVRVFSVSPPPLPGKAGLITYTGGLGIASLDALNRFSLEIAQLSSVTKSRLANLFPSWMSVTNPVDIWPPMMLSQPVLNPLRQALGTLLADPQINAVLFIGGALFPKFTHDVCQLLLEMAEAQPDKPLVCCIYGPYAHEASACLQSTGRIAVFPTPERAARALARLVQYYRGSND